MRSNRCKILVPLEDFEWAGNDYPGFPGLQIRRFDSTPELFGLDEGNLSDNQMSRLAQAGHWLTFAGGGDEFLSSSETVNLFLLSLWVVKPTKTRAWVRFEINQDEDMKSVGGTYFMLDQFSWLPETVELTIDDHDLSDAAEFYRRFLEVRRSGRRLHHAAVLTYAGCIQYSWSVSLICFASAAEALLTHDRRPGLTKRLSLAFACLTESDAVARDRAYSEFFGLYDIRSDIVHGRLYKREEFDRLEVLGRFQSALRKLWAAVLLSHLSELEGSDDQRRVYIERQQASYEPPA